MNREQIYSILFFLVQIPVWAMNVFCVKMLQTELNGEPLPGLTEIMISIKHVWPSVFMLCFLTAVYFSGKSVKKAQHIILTTSLIEVTYIMVVASSYALPFYGIVTKL